MEKLTVSQENYLKAVHLLTACVPAARVTDIADMLQVTKASASRAIGCLEAMGLVERENREVLLTEKGKTAVRQVMRRYDIIRMFLFRFCKHGCHLSHSEACKLEHLLSDASVQAMQRALQPQAA